MCTLVYYVQDILYPFLIGFAHPGPGRVSLIEQHILPNCWSAGMGFQLSPNAAICCHILISSTAPTVIFAATIMLLEYAESAALMFPPDNFTRRYATPLRAELLVPFTAGMACAGTPAPANALHFFCLASCHWTGSSNRRSDPRCPNL